VEKIEMKKEDFDALVANLSKEAKGLIEYKSKMPIKAILMPSRR